MRGCSAPTTRHRDGLHQYLRPARSGLRHRVGHVRGDGRLGQRGVPGAVRIGRGHLRALRDAAATPPTSRRWSRLRRRPSRSRGSPPRMSRTPRTPRPSRRSSTWPTPGSRAPTGRGRPPTRSRTSCCALDHPDGSSSPLVVGLPGDREVDMKRLEAQVAPAVPAPFEEADFAKYPQSGEGVHRSAGAGGGAPASPTWSTRASSTGTAWITGANEQGRHVFDLVCGRDFTPDGDDRGRRGARRRPGAGRLRPAGCRPRHRDRAHLPAGPQVRGGARPDGARRARQVPRGHHGFVRDRGVARRGGDRRAAPRRARV